MKFEEEKLKNNFPEIRGGGSKALWNFSEMQSVFETPPIPKVVLFGGYCDYYGVHHPVTRGKPILPPLIVLAPILIILTFPDALMIAMFPRQIIIWISHLSSQLKGLSRWCTLLMKFAIKDDDDKVWVEIGLVEGKVFYFAGTVSHLLLWLHTL